jgi:hypothetical protein
MSFLVKEYKIPFLGKVKLVEATDYDESFNGKYYADNKKIGKGFVKNCNSLEELQNKVMSELKGYFHQKKAISELTIESEKEKLRELESTFLDVEEEIKNDSFEWLQQYQTDNPLQLEYQEAEEEKLKAERNKK